jgi:hypothetical protein
MLALLRSAQNLPTWWHERDRRRRGLVPDGHRLCLTMIDLDNAS